MAKFVKVLQASEIEEGKGKVVRVEGRTLAMFKIGDEIFAMDNYCLHRGGPLGEGSLKDHGVTCPWHGWSYDVRTGAFNVITALKVKTYPVRQEGDSVFVEFDGNPAPNQMDFIEGVLQRPGP